MEWPWRRFLKAFDAYQRRSLCEEWRQRKVAHITALFSNTNLDDERNDRQAIVDRLEHSYDELIAHIWNGAEGITEEKAAEEEQWSSPFMRAGRKALASVQPPVLPGENTIGALP